jgi:hypothetical protein
VWGLLTKRGTVLGVLGLIGWGILIAVLVAASPNGST